MTLFCLLTAGVISNCDSSVKPVQETNFKSLQRGQKIIIFYQKWLCFTTVSLTIIFDFFYIDFQFFLFNCNNSRTPKTLPANRPRYTFIVAPKKSIKTKTNAHFTYRLWLLTTSVFPCRVTNCGWFSVIRSCSCNLSPGSDRVANKPLFLALSSLSSASKFSTRSKLARMDLYSSSWYCLMPLMKSDNLALSLGSSTLKWTPKIR